MILEHGSPISVPDAVGGSRHRHRDVPIVVIATNRPMSACSYKQTLAGLKTTSALHPGADLPGGPPLKVKLTSVAESCLASLDRGTPGRVRSLRTDSWAGSGLRAPFCLWNQSVGPLSRRPRPGGVPNAHLPLHAPRSGGRRVDLGGTTAGRLTNAHQRCSRG